MLRLSLEYAIKIRDGKDWVDYPFHPTAVQRCIVSRAASVFSSFRWLVCLLFWTYESYPIGTGSVICARNTFIPVVITRLHECMPSWPGGSTIIPTQHHHVQFVQSTATCLFTSLSNLVGSSVKCTDRWLELKGHGLSSTCHAPLDKAYLCLPSLNVWGLK